MARWVRAGLGNYDNVHFTRDGYKKLAGMLYGQLMAEYAKYVKSNTPIIEPAPVAPSSPAPTPAAPAAPPSTPAPPNPPAAPRR